MYGIVRHLRYNLDSYLCSALLGIADALVTRLVAAANEREQFRVILVLPQHPSGDFLNPSRYPVIERNMAMQNKSLLAIVESFQKQCPNVIWSEYLGFFSLRNWGIMNDKVVTSSVFVSSSVLIVDDRVAVVGGAGINDQGMRGTHDSNIAMSIEDNTPVSIQLGGRSYEASRFAHTLRMNLMRHHIADHDPFSTDLTDMATHAHVPMANAGISVERLNGYDGVWQRIATQNAELHNLLDGEYALSNIKSVDAFRKKNVKENFIHKSTHDPHVQAMVEKVQGFLVPFPLHFSMS